MAWDDLLRLLAALAAGGLIGFERELHDKPAGFRTHILITLGAATFTLLSQRFAESIGGDPVRVAAHVVVGIGFLGAGTILHARGQVIGLTTAATIWVSAAVGMAFGAGQHLVGLTTTLLVVGVLTGLPRIEAIIQRRHSVATFEITSDAGSLSSEDLLDMVKQSGLEGHSASATKRNDELTIMLEVRGQSERLEAFHRRLIGEARVKAVTRY